MKDVYEKTAKLEQLQTELVECEAACSPKGRAPPPREQAPPRGAVHHQCAVEESTAMDHGTAKFCTECGVKNARDAHFCRLWSSLLNNRK